jgi:2-haloacid dehalogenase
MTNPTAVIFDVGKVLHRWEPELLYARRIPDDAARSAFLRDVLTTEWHFQHDAGRDFAETSAELIAAHPHHADDIRVWGSNFLDTLPGPVAGMPELVAELDARGVPLFAITNFSHEFWPPFREREAALFAPFRDIVVSGDEKLTKPDAAIYRLAVERFGLAPHEALFVDDSLPNVEGARAVGLHAHHFVDEPTLRPALEDYGLL